MESRYSVFSSCLELGIKNAILDIELPDYEISLIEYYIDKKFKDINVISDESFSKQIKGITFNFFQSILLDGVFGKSILDFLKKRPKILYKISDKIIKKTSFHDTNFSFYSKRITLSLMMIHMFNRYDKSENLDNLISEIIDRYKIINKIKQKMVFFKR